ncbi:GRAM domain protein [Aspergillus heteromorphus CBS 117.55]|uniref:GRAM domain protein n=1 Tax=Aspergillus heteromorphus CBS 117.55 TaxID=1448321 RepID=A0A317W1H8_9EURO|nr:GRAM domain protein [Aspergillus heteromorphus CBS 117.55]PWY79122.1 GRAM domain protein [Aspergillus heteromorphus CBS 117.55]
MDNSAIPEPPPVPESDVPSFKISRTKTTPVDLEMGSSGRSNGRSPSIDSTVERPKSQAGDGDSTKAGPTGFSKLLAGRRKKKKKEEPKDEPLIDLDGDMDVQEVRSESRDGASAHLSATNEGQTAADNDALNLLTDDSEPERTPPLTSHNSHAGFYTSSSPLIKTMSADANDEGAQGDVDSAVSGPSAAPESLADTELSSQPASSLNVPADRNGKKRGISPGRRFKNAFTSSQDKKNSSRDRASSTSSTKSTRSNRRGSMSAKRAQTVIAEDPPPLPAPIRTDLKEDKALPSLDIPQPRTPPHTAIPQPQTTVTPPTPHTEFPKLFTSPIVTRSPDSINSKDGSPSGIVVSPSGNMISHRRVRSASAASHKPSKLSNSISALGPTVEESKAISKSPSAQQTGFFSSMFTAAQNAASSFGSSINAQAKARNAGQAGTAEFDNRPTSEEVSSSNQPADNSQVEEKKSLAIDTLGSGDLDFSHLDIAIPPGGSVSTPDGVVITKPDIPLDKRKNTGVHQRDEQAARLEDSRAARAVTMAYEKPSDTLLAPDDGLDVQSTTSLVKDTGGDQTPPTGSVLDGEVGNTRPHRSGSVRSRLARRRHRGSSATTSTIGAIGASAIALGAPAANASMPRLTGFAVASKKRNRDFHQLFRSVPEDDYLIEDYSCALQREIILAGRIYISEGHICFSSNILGWVTTLVISFDEVVAIEKESTAMVFPNAIAIQTLHARHTFRSLLSRESTYDLMVNIWKINHPSLKSSANGTRVTDGTGDKTEKAGDGESDDESEEEDEIYDEDEEGDNADSLFEAAGASINGSEKSLPPKSVSRKASGALQNAGAGTGGSNGNGDSKGSKSSSPADSDTDFPGPPTHAPTEFTDPSGQYDKLIKDDIIPAPLGKVYSLIFGPASGAFIPKFLVENQKSGELQFEGGNKGLTNDSRTRKYSYIKPLNGAIGPKQTKCISTETLDFLDLEKAVLVTLSTQTPDVPSGNVFLTKTKYLFTWAPGNHTRFLVTCTIEWSGKSWLKGPIEKGAIDGQTTFGNELVAALKAAVVPRARTGGGKSKGKGKRKKSEVAQEAAAAATKAVEAQAQQASSWGVLEPLHGLLEPVIDIVKPLLSGNVVIAIVGILLFLLFFRSPSQPSIVSHDIGCPGYSLPQRLAAYEEMWRREESELWSWLEDRVGMDGLAFPTVSRPMESRVQGSRKVQSDRMLASKVGEEKMSDLEMDHAIRTTRERLDSLERILSQRRSADQEPIHPEL